MLGYRIYFDGDKFLAEYTQSVVEDRPGDCVEDWYSSAYSAACAVNLLNSAYRKNREDLCDANDFLIQTCKDCCEYFILPASEVKWFEDKGFKLPCRCYSCRLKRRPKRKKKQNQDFKGGK